MQNEDRRRKVNSYILCVPYLLTLLGQQKFITTRSAVPLNEKKPALSFFSYFRFFSFILKLYACSQPDSCLSFGSKGKK